MPPPFWERNVPWRRLAVLGFILHATDPQAIVPILSYGLSPSTLLQEEVTSLLFKLVVDANKHFNRDTVQVYVLDPEFPDPRGLRAKKPILFIYDANNLKRNLGNLWVAHTNGQYAPPEVISSRFVSAIIAPDEVLYVSQQYRGLISLMPWWPSHCDKEDPSASNEARKWCKESGNRPAILLQYIAGVRQ